MSDDLIERTLAERCLLANGHYANPMISDEHLVELADALAAQAAEIARLKALLDEAEGEVRDLVTAITYADPPKLFNGVECHEARVPIEFVTAARAFLAKLKGTDHASE